MTNTQVEQYSELDLLWKEIATLKDAVDILLNEHIILNNAITKSIEIHTKRADSHHRLLTDLVVDIGMLKERS